MLSAPRTRRSPFRRLAAAFLAAAQFSVVSFAPALDAAPDTNAPVHVEALGVHLHFVHNPDDCAACTAQTLVAVAPAAPSPLENALRATTAFEAADLSTPERSAWRPDAARAPPAPTGARSLF